MSCCCGSMLGASKCRAKSRWRTRRDDGQRRSQECIIALWEQHSLIAHSAETAAGHADRVLRCEKPGDLPSKLQQSTSLSSTSRPPEALAFRYRPRASRAPTSEIGTSRTWRRSSAIAAFRRYVIEVNFCNLVTPQYVHLSWTSCHFGNYRPWMLCSYCRKRVARLFNGMGGFFCRACVGNPPYESQLRNEMARVYFASLPTTGATWRLPSGSRSNSCTSVADVAKNL